MQDPEDRKQDASYELAFRMQSAAPSLIDLSGESKSTLDAYGVERPQHPQANRARQCCQCASFLCAKLLVGSQDG